MRDETNTDRRNSKSGGWRSGSFGQGVDRIIGPTYIAITAGIDL